MSDANTVDENISRTLGQIMKKSNEAILNAPAEVTVTATLKGADAAAYHFLYTVIKESLGYDDDAINAFILRQGVYHERVRMVIASLQDPNETSNGLSDSEA